MTMLIVLIMYKNQIKWKIEGKKEEEREEGTTIEKVDDFEIQMKSEVYAS